MDMSFANQALSAEYIVKHGKSLEKKVYVVPRDIDLEIARLKLASMDVQIDLLTSAQEEYLSSWTHGTYPLQRGFDRSAPADAPRGWRFSVGNGGPPPRLGLWLRPGFIVLT